MTAVWRAAVVALLLLAACSGDDGDGDAAPTTQSGVPTSSSVTTAVATSSTVGPGGSSSVPTTGTPVTTAAPAPTTTLPNRIVVGTVTFHAPPSWGSLAGAPGTTYVGVLAGGRGDITLRVETGFAGAIDALAPTTCLGAPVVAPARVELVESGFRPVGDKVAEFRFWRSSCPAGDIKVEEHRAWLLPVSGIAIFEQRHEPEVEAVVTTAQVL